MSLIHLCWHHQSAAQWPILKTLDCSKDLFSCPVSLKGEIKRNPDYLLNSMPYPLTLLNEFKTQQQSSNFANFYFPQLPQPSKTWYWRMSEEGIEKILGLTEFNLLKHPSLHGFWIIICKSIPHKATITILSTWKPSSSNPKQVLVFF